VGKLRQVTVGGCEVAIRGVNLGSWLNIEDFMIGLDGTDWQLRAEFRRQLGADTAERFFRRYHEGFVTEADIRNIVRLGFNCVRVPFNWRYFETDARPGDHRAEAFLWLDRLFAWCDQAGLLVLLDFHALPGGQNTTRPADNPTGYPGLWASRDCQDRAVALWEAMARRYRGRPSLLGHNLMNEPQVNQHGEQDPGEQAAAMNRLCHRLAASLRAIDPDAWIVIEGPVRSSGGLALLDPALFADPRTAVSYHHYPQASHEGGINFEPDRPEAETASALRDFIARQTEAELAYARRVDRPMILGECGVAARFDPGWALAVLDAQLDVARERGFGWMIWSYKDVGPMGLVTPAPETAWRRFVESGPVVAPGRQCRESFKRHFDEVYIPLLGKDQASVLHFDAAYGDMLRGLSRIVLRQQVRELAKAFSPDEIAALPEAFLLANCREKPDYIGLLRRHLAAP